MMARFLVTYYEGGDLTHDPEMMAKARDAFMAWAQKTGMALVEPGAPIAAKKTVSGAGTGDGKGQYSGWSVVEATDLDAAVQLLADHPFIGRGGTLEVSEPGSI
jgi:YCII-related domain